MTYLTQLLVSVVSAIAGTVVGALLGYWISMGSWRRQVGLLLAREICKPLYAEIVQGMKKAEACSALDLSGIRSTTENVYYLLAPKRIKEATAEWEEMTSSYNQSRERLQGDILEVFEAELEERANSLAENRRQEALSAIRRDISRDNWLGDDTLADLVKSELTNDGFWFIANAKRKWANSPDESSLVVGMPAAVHRTVKDRDSFHWYLDAREALLRAKSVTEAFRREMATIT